MGLIMQGLTMRIMYARVDMKLIMQWLTRIIDQGVTMPKVDNEGCDMVMKWIMKRLVMVMELILGWIWF